MKATITDAPPPQPKPPRMVTLEMTEEEARVLKGIALCNHTIADVVYSEMNVADGCWPKARSARVLSLLGDIDSAFEALKIRTYAP